jgi:hypothetical protein
MMHAPRGGAQPRAAARGAGRRGCGRPGRPAVPYELGFTPRPSPLPLDATTTGGALPIVCGNC